MTTQLEKICTINMGQSPDSSTYNEDGNGLPFFQGNADFGEIYPAVRMWCSKPTKIARKKDILISVRAPIGALNIANCECCIGRGLAALTVNENICVLEFLWHALSNKIEELNSKGTGSTFKAINKKILAETEIPLPPLDEQRKIAVVLDKVSDLIAKRRQQLDKLDLLIKSRFVEMFGDRLANEKKWNRKELQKCAEFYNGKAHEQVIDENGQYILVTSKFIASNQKEYRKTNELLFPLYSGDICMVMSDVPNGRALAKCVLIDKDNKYTLNQRICCFRNYELNTIFLIYVLNRHEYFLSFDDGDSQTNLRKNDILACPIILPPIQLQNQFAAFVEQTERTKTTISRSLEKLETLKKALMQEYFG